MHSWLLPSTSQHSSHSSISPRGLRLATHDFIFTRLCYDYITCNWPCSLLFVKANSYFARARARILMTMEFFQIKLFRQQMCRTVQCTVRYNNNYSVLFFHYCQKISSFIIKLNFLDHCAMHMQYT